ncbi:MAG: hypothetical protein AB1589_32465, partial [Cyanobacteriota bacterium]
LDKGGLRGVNSTFARGLVNMIVASKPTLPHQRVNVQLAQRRIGECRAATRSTFIYQERSTANPIRALQPNEQVTLAQESNRGGWIAINSPLSGFVQTNDLKLCSNASSRPSPSNLCRQVTYKGTEGVAVRERPNFNARQIDTVFLGNLVTLSNPPQFVTDDTGREWARLASPTAGWMSNGFPATGDLNLEACL